MTSPNAEVKESGPGAVSGSGCSRVCESSAEDAHRTRFSDASALACDSVFLGLGMSLVAGPSSVGIEGESVGLEKATPESSKSVSFVIFSPRFLVSITSGVDDTESCCFLSMG